MNSIYDLKSILNAVEEINTKTKEKFISSTINNAEKIKKNKLTNDAILPITEKIILEAEEHSKKIKINVIPAKESIPLAKKSFLESKNKLSEFENKTLILTPSVEEGLILDKEYNADNLEEIKLNVINDLYSSLSQKVKKNTLKIIFDLRKKIHDLEKEIEAISVNKTDQDFAQDINIDSVNEDKEHLINEKASDEDDHLINQEDTDLSESTIKTLKIQNSLIKNFERSEKKFRLKIVDLEQNITILTNKKTNFNKNIHNEAIEFNENILINKTVSSHQDNFNIQSELYFFKKNYEKLIIENDSLKKKLSISKERVIKFEKNIKELETAFENLNNILSKNSITKLNEQPLKNFPDADQLEQNNIKTKFSSINNTDKEKK